MHLTNEELLVEAIEEHDFKSFMTLLKKGVNLDTQYDEDGIYFNSLEVAVYESFEIKSLDYVKVLLEYGADIHIVLSMVAMNSHIEIAQLLLKYGADVNLLDKEITTVLFYAMNQGFFEEAKLFLNAGAYATINKNNVGIPCLCTVLGNCSLDITKVRFLLDHGANAAIRDIDNMLALEIMETNKDKVSSKKDYQELQTLLNPNNPPYLKLGENEEDKYIIYENK